MVYYKTRVHYVQHKHCKGDNSNIFFLELVYSTSIIIFYVECINKLKLSLQLQYSLIFVLVKYRFKSNT